MSASDLALSVRGLSKSYTIAHQATQKESTLAETVLQRLKRPFARSTKETFWALKDISFDVKKGEVVGIIGRNGAGKSTLLKVLSRITEPTEGQIDLYGRVGSLLEVGTGFHPELTGRENVFLNGAILGMSRAEIKRQFDAIVDFAGVEKFLDTPVKRYSSGMYVRLAFAVAAHLKSEILIVDEVLAVGDVSFQRKCLDAIQSVSQAGRTVLFVSHSMGAVQRLCSTAVCLQQGHVIKKGSTSDIVREYMASSTKRYALREWPDPRTAPGDSVARLVSVRTLNPDGASAIQFDVSEPIRVEIQYEQLAEQRAKPLTLSAHVVSDLGVTVCVSNDFENEEWLATPRRKGIVRATFTVPANFLSVGSYSLLVAVCTYDPNVVHGLEPAAVAFDIVDNGDSVRRRHFGGEWPGVVRPILPWSASYV